MIGNTYYLNSGDWVESLTTIVETNDREFKVINFNELKNDVEKMSRENVQKYVSKRSLRTERVFSN